MTRRNRGRSGPPRRKITESAVKKDLWLFVEGRRTEEDYVVYWRRHFRDRVRVTVDDFRGPPLKLVERAVIAKRRSERDARANRGRAYDEFWCMFDRDDHPYVLKAIALAKANHVHLAISNPCMELWIILHFRDQTAHIDRGTAQILAEKLVACSKSLTPAALQALADRHDDAMRRANSLDVKHSGDGSPPGSNPSSGVWALVESMRTGPRIL